MGRSISFERYLRSLPADERRRIEDAESAYLESTAKRNASLERDYADSLTGHAEAGQSKRRRE